MESYDGASKCNHWLNNPVRGFSLEAQGLGLHAASAWMAQVQPLVGGDPACRAVHPENKLIKDFCWNNAW